MNGTETRCLPAASSVAGEGRRTLRSCPRCGAKLFQDMEVCYGCLYDFSKAGAPAVGAVAPAAGSAAGLPSALPAVEPSAGLPPLDEPWGSAPFGGRAQLAQDSAERSANANQTHAPERAQLAGGALALGAVMRSDPPEGLGKSALIDSSGRPERSQLPCPSEHDDRVEPPECLKSASFPAPASPSGCSGFSETSEPADLSKRPAPPKAPGRSRPSHARERPKEAATTLLAPAPELSLAPTGGPARVRVSAPGISIAFSLAAQGLAVGRDPANDLVLESRAVSRRHLRLEEAAGGVRVRGLGATNPPLLNGRPLREDAALAQGDALELRGTGVIIQLCAPAQGNPD